MKEKIELKDRKRKASLDISKEAFSPKRVRNNDMQPASGSAASRNANNYSISQEFLAEQYVALETEYQNYMQEQYAAAMEEEEQATLAKKLASAVTNNWYDVASALINLGANRGLAIDAAIAADSVEMLQLLEASSNDDNISAAAEGLHLKALDYFLETLDEIGTIELGHYETILRVAAEKSNRELVVRVCQYADADLSFDWSRIYELMQFLVNEGGEILIPAFFDHFKPVELLEEIAEQDDDGDLFRLVLDYAKDRLSEQEIFDLDIFAVSKWFDSGLKISSKFLCYPKNGFKGNLTLKELRAKFFDEKLSLTDEQKLAANAIGVSLSTASRDFTVSPYHPPTDRNNSEHYFRAKSHPDTLPAAPYKPSRELPESMATGTKKANCGLHLHPLQSLNKEKAVDDSKESEEMSASPETKQSYLNADGCHFYDRLLIFKYSTCKFIVDRFLTSSTGSRAIRVGFYNNYPCVMVLIEKTRLSVNKSDAKLEAWTHLVMSYFVALVNYAARQQNLDIELVKRSSFGFLTPTIAPCGQSFRINVGLIPDEYADILSNCLIQLEKVLVILNDENSDLNRELNDLPADCFWVNPSDYEKYCARALPDVNNNMLTLLWTKVETGGGGTTARSLARTPLARDGISSEIYRKLVGGKNLNVTNHAQIFLDALRWGIGRLELQMDGKQTLTFNTHFELEFNTIPLVKGSTVIKDDNFFDCIAHMIATVQHMRQFDEVDRFLTEVEDRIILEIEHCKASKTVDNLYFNLEMLNELLYARAVLTCPKDSQDPFGSDSEDETTEEDPSQRRHGKKLTVQNGMRALLASLRAGTNYLYPDYFKEHGEKKPFYLYGVYYETEKAIECFKEFDLIINDVKRIGQTEILIYDINFCETGDSVKAPLTPEQLASIRVMILDATSATSMQQSAWVERFQQLPKMEILFLASSGFKNQQMGADKNPYGTIRIVTKGEEGKNLRERIMDAIRAVEEPLKSRVAHHVRRQHKRLGNVPTSKDILHGKEKKKDSDITMSSESPAQAFGSNAPVPEKKSRVRSPGRNSFLPPPVGHSTSGSMHSPSNPVTGLGTSKP